MSFLRAARRVGLFGFALVAVTAAAAAPLAPFSADYVVSRDGKQLGRATLTLQRAGDGTWQFSERTEGTKGMAGLLGVDIEESSTFRWHDGLPQGLQYRYEQHAAIKSRTRSTDFDWQAHEARSRDGKRSWTAPLDGPAMDRNLVTLALMTALPSGAPLAFPVVDKDRIAEQSYARGARETLDLPAGRIDTVRVERRRDDNPRTTTIWFAPQRNWLPVQIEQVEKNGETLTMRLEKAR